jgi:hypothetical protein
VYEAVKKKIEKKEERRATVGKRIKKLGFFF